MCVCMCVCVCVCVTFPVQLEEGREEGGREEGGEGGGWSVFVVSGVGSNKRCGVGEASEKVQMVIKKHLL